MSTFRKITYRAGLFDSINLTTHAKIDEALYEFVAVLNKGNYSQVLEDLLDKSHIVELILSGISDEIPLQDWMLEDFASTPQFFETTFSCKLLLKLSEFFLFHSSGDPLLRKHHQTVRLGAEILQALYALSLLGSTHPASSDRPGANKKSKAKSSQKEAKQAHRSTRRPAFNEAPFMLTDIPVPQTPSDAVAAISTFFESLKETLKFYLTKIRTEIFCTIIRESFIPQERPAELHVNTVATIVVEDPLPPAPTTATATVTAFPMVQPMKSALYFDSPEGFGKWSILVSSSAHQDLRKHHRKAKASFDIIVNKMKALSNGHFSFDNQKRLNGPGTEVPIYEAKLSGDLRLVYQVDCVPSYDIETETQVLRIYGIYTHAQMDKRLWDSVSSRRSKRGGEYRSRCLQRKRQDGDVFLPICFSSLDEVEEDSSLAIPDLPPDGDNQLHKILTLEKYVTLSKELLDSIEDNRNATFPFEVSKYERKIIEHPFSCYVLGRSGTGKTTTMLYKMLRVERDYQMNRDHTVKPRQVFVTQSRVLAAKVEDLFASYLESLGASSRGYKEHGSSSCDDSETDQHSGLEDENVEWRNDLPQRFSELEDKHFPLFLTVDRLYTLIETDITFSDRDVKSNSNFFEIRSPTSSQPSTTTKGKLITYDRFLGEYWPHLTQSLKRNFNPSLVFSEFMGVIQGSEGTITSSSGCLDRKTYEELPARTQPTFAEHRPTVYGLFESYRKLKNERRDYDAPDRTHDILRAITKRQGLLGQTFDYVYVDETQDNLLVDSLVLRLLSRNTDGLFWAGDTAQTISAGSSFRFDDLTSFLFRFEEQRRLQNTLPPSERRKKSRKPKPFHLTINYRSHSGIVNCAHSVIELISKHWPYSIDSLPRERGNTDGMKPIFYQDIYPGFIHDGHFLSRGKDSVEKIELGADQCILVRDDAAKQRLEEEIGKVGIIITLYDSKGLEFNDVFLYNFFHDSGVDVSQWRVVLNSITMDELLSPASKAAPRFDSTRHAAICAELKSLYVAVTRARNNLRIADESLKGEPMRALWTHRGQIRNCHPSDDLSDFATPSSKDEWAKRAVEMSRNHKYVLARDSFEKAGQLQEAAFENARHLQQVAVRTPADHRTRKREAAFKSAAEAFLSCADNSMKTNTKKICYKSSAECFEQAGENLSAARIYRQAEEFTKASRLFRKIGRFDDVHSIIVNHGEKIDDVESIRDVARLYYVNQKKFNKAHELFDTIEEEIEYLEDRNLDLAQVDLLLIHGRKVEAADLHLSEGRFLEAAKLFIEDGKHNLASFQRAVVCILRGLWQTMPVGTMGTASIEVTKYLACFDTLEKGSMRHMDLLEFKMFQAIVSGETSELALISEALLDAGNTDAAFLCLDHYFVRIPSLDAMDIMQMAISLRLFFTYIQMLHNFTISVDDDQSRVMKLFGITKSDKDFIVTHNTALYRFASPPTQPRGSSCDPICLSKDEFLTVYQSCLQDRLLDRVTRENDVCRRSPALYVRLHYTSDGEFSVSTSNGTQVSPDATWYRDWLSVHLLQISIYNTISRIQFQNQMKSERRFWIRKLYEVLNPLHYSLGSPYHIDCDVVDVRKALAVVIDWARAISFHLDLNYWPNSSFLTSVMQVADLAFAFDKREASVYMYRPGFINSPHTPYVFIRNGQPLMQELLMSLNGKGTLSLVMGILFIRHVMEKAIDIDINVFTSFIEKICTLLVIYNRFQWRGNLHGIILPRSWIRNALNSFDPMEASQQDTKRYWLLLQPLYGIVNGLYFHRVDHLMFGHEMRSASSQGYTIRSTFISRICRVLGLLGTNFRLMQADILTGFAALRRSENQGFPRIYSSYIYAESFEGIAKATRRSMQKSSLDEIVQLLFSERVQYPVYDIYGLRRIVYTRQEDIISLLNTNGPNLPNAFSDLEPANARPLMLEEPTESRPLDVEEKILVDEDDLINDKTIDDIDRVDREFVPQLDISKDVHIGHSDREVAAACGIQIFCRMALHKIHLSKESSLEGSIYRWFIQCLRTTRPLVATDVHPRYSIRFLGFVPALLGCLDGVNSLVFAKKTELKRRLSRSGRHEELDDVSRALTRISYLTKAIKSHRNILLPGSDFHLRRDVDQLKKRTQSALDLMSDLQLPLNLPDDIRQHLHTIYKGMLKEPRIRKATKKEKRPALKMDDDIESYGCNWEEDWEKEETFLA